MRYPELSWLTLNLKTSVLKGRGRGECKSKEKLHGGGTVSEDEGSDWVILSQARELLLPPEITKQGDVLCKGYGDVRCCQPFGVRLLVSPQL